MAEKTSQVTWAQAVRDTAIHSMNKGQLPVLGLIALLLLALWKYPPDRLATIAESTLLRALIASLAFNIALIIAWFLHSRSIRRSQAKELDRIGQEKSSLQEQVTNRKLSTSAKPHRKHK
jgi:hypothetical protein